MVMLRQENPEQFLCIRLECLHLFFIVLWIDGKSNLNTQNSFGHVSSKTVFGWSFREIDEEWLISACFWELFCSLVLKLPSLEHP